MQLNSLHIKKNIAPLKIKNKLTTIDVHMSWHRRSLTPEDKKVIL